MTTSFAALRLQTARLNLRPLQLADADDLFRMHSDAEFMRYWAWAPWTTVAQAVALIESDLQQLAAGRHVRLGLFRREDGRFVGTCSLFNLVPGCRRAELGYGIVPAHWRQGYMAEAVGALIGWAFGTLGLNRLEADIDPRNTASARGLAKLGFRHEGLLHERWIVDGAVSDSALYGLLVRDWRAAVDRLAPDPSAAPVADPAPVPTPGPAAAPAAVPASPVTITEGYAPGCIGRIVALHAAYYAARHGFGAPFEAKVAQELAAFCQRDQAGRDGLWLAWSGGELQGAVAIDGARAAEHGARLRWFILSDALRGQGVGRALLDRALAFADAGGHDRVTLWTFQGLDAARHLYEARGFRLAEQAPATTWGPVVDEQRFERLRG